MRKWGLRAKRTRKKCARGYYNIYEGTPRERTKKVGNIEDSKRGYNLVVFKRVTQTPHTRCIIFLFDNDRSHDNKKS